MHVLLLKKRTAVYFAALSQPETLQGARQAWVVPPASVLSPELLRYDGTQQLFSPHDSFN